MNNQQQQAVIERFVSDVNEGDLSVIDELLTRDFYQHRPAEDAETQTGVVAAILADLQGAFPDLRLETSNFAAEGDTLVFDLTIRGTHRASLWGGPASGQTVDWTTRVQTRFADGKFAFQWPELAMPQVLPVLRSIDMMPAPEDMDKPPKYPVQVPEFLLKLFFTGQAADKPCSHLAEIQVIEPSNDVCPQCVAMGDIWPALRMCLFCGFVGCCDTSKNKHMKQHYQETGHPLFRSIRLDEGWVWCYEDNAFFTSRVLASHGPDG